jgi:hypothetical protein
VCSAADVVEVAACRRSFVINEVDRAARIDGALRLNAAVGNGDVLDARRRRDAGRECDRGHGHREKSADHRALILDWDISERA